VRRRAAGHPNWGKNVNASINTIRVEAVAGPCKQQQQQDGQQQGQGQQQEDGLEQEQGQDQQQQQQQQPPEQQAAPQRFLWAVVRWGDADHLGSVGALASAFGGGTEG